MSPEEIIRQYQDKPVWAVMRTEPHEILSQGCIKMTLAEAQRYADELREFDWYTDVKILLQIEDLE